MCRQLTEEQIPTRQQQLLEMYGPGGSQPLLPSSQPDSPGLILNRIDITTALSQRYVEIKNPLDYAVDVTNWELSGAVNAKIKPGTNKSLISFPMISSYYEYTHEMYLKYTYKKTTLVHKIVQF